MSRPITHHIHNRRIATTPIHKPHHCFTLIFSLQITTPATADKITLEPFTTGKKNTLGITLDKYILNILASATLKIPRNCQAVTLFMKWDLLCIKTVNYPIIPEHVRNTAVLSNV